MPLDFVIGGEQGIGRGWSMLMTCLAAGRAISLPALGTAGTKFAARTTSAYAQVRKQFNISIGRMEGVEEAIARIAGRLTCSKRRASSPTPLSMRVSSRR